MNSCTSCGNLKPWIIKILDEWLFRSPMREIIVMPGDELILECEYDTSARENITFGGGKSSSIIWGECPWKCYLCSSEKDTHEKAVNAYWRKISIKTLSMLCRESHPYWRCSCFQDCPPKRKCVWGSFTITRGRNWPIVDPYLHRGRFCQPSVRQWTDNNGYVT